MHKHLGTLNHEQRIPMVKSQIRASKYIENTQRLSSTYF